jgi:hypothetical protein
MSTAVSEILKQAEQLSPDERVELMTGLMEQAQRRAAPPLRNGEASGAESLSQPGVEERGSENGEEEDWLGNLDLKPMPPKWTYTGHVQFHYVGRLQPLPYDFGDFFDDEEEGER